MPLRKVLNRKNVFSKTYISMNGLFNFLKREAAVLEKRVLSSEL